MTTSRTITLRGTPLMDEGHASVAIMPGMLCEPTPASSTNQFRPHATAGGTASPMFAIEWGGNSGKGIDDVYAIGDLAFIGAYRTGDWVNVLIQDGENIAFADKLESAGNGKLQEVRADPSDGTIKVNSVVAWAKEACNMTGTTDADPNGGRCWAQII